MGIFFKTLFKVLSSVANVFLLPVNTILTQYFPTFSEQLTSFRLLVLKYFGQPLAWFFHILPPNTRATILFYIACLGACYTITLAVHAVVKIIELIKNVKVW